jgi:hypothetical protein
MAKNDGKRRGKEAKWAKNERKWAKIDRNRPKKWMGKKVKREQKKKICHVSKKNEIKASE